jgi:hypothetical protein
MTTFPSLVPNEISFDHGQANVSEYESFGLGPIRFRHSQYINGQNLNLVYRGLSQASVELIRQHYKDVGGTHGSFAAPTAIWGGAALPQSDSTYRYADTPTEEHTGLHYNVSVSLRLLQGVFMQFILEGGDASLPAETTISAFVFSGVAPIILNGTDEATATLRLDATQTS